MDPLDNLFNSILGKSAGKSAKTDPFATDEYQNAEDREQVEEYLEAEDQDNDFADSEFEDGDYDGDEYND